MKTKILHLFVLLALLIGLLAVTPVAPARASTLTVDTLTDEADGSCIDGDCSLRDAVAAAISNDTITFSVNGRRVLPTPGGPIKVTRRISSLVSIWNRTADSDSRPSSGVRLTGRAAPGRGRSADSVFEAESSWGPSAANSSRRAAQAGSFSMRRAGMKRVRKMSVS